MTFDRHPDLLGRLEFRRKLFGRVFADGGKEVAVDTAEVAFDPLLLRNGFDAVDRGGVTFVKRLGAIEAAHLRDRFETVIGLRCQMSAGPRRHAAGNATAVEDRDLLAAAREFIGRGKAGDSRTDHDGVDPLVVGERWCIRNHRVRPERAASFVGSVHGQTSLVITEKQAGRTSIRECQSVAASQPARRGNGSRQPQAKRQSAF